LKLLFDQNLSPRLVSLLADVFPGSSHVQSVGLERASDEAVWQFALAQNLTIVSKDSDFQERSQVAGTAPCVVWIRRGNVATAEIEAMLRNHAAEIMSLGSAQEAEFLILL
jgi:predicted nuclease of predicted toxin-antitoxin system